jgi:putative transposase
MISDENEKKIREIQEFRFSIISEIANPYLDWGEIDKLIREKAKRTYSIPYSKRTTLSRACIKKWYLRFKKYGKPGLSPKPRSDSGKCRVLSQEEQNAIIKVLEQKLDISASGAVRKLQREGVITNPVSRSTLSRFIIASGLDRKSRRKQKSEELTLKFDFFAPLECVQSDCLHTFPVPDGKGKKQKAILLVFIDDATRRIIYSNFSFSESALEFEKGIKHILKAHGRIGALYTDNGATFVSNQTSRILDILGIPLFHSRPYKPQGKGKNERFFRTANDQFIRLLDQEAVKSLADLNMKFRTWLETEYHRTPHSGLNNIPPLDAWLAKTNYIIPIDPTIDLDQVFLHEAKRKVYKDNTFTLLGTLFEVPVPLAGVTVKLLYDPHSPVFIPQVHHEGKLQGNARRVDSYANSRVRRSVINHGCIQKETPIADSQPDVKTGFNNTQASLAASKIPLQEENHE